MLLKNIQILSIFQYLRTPGKIYMFSNGGPYVRLVPNLKISNFLTIMLKIALGSHIIMY